MILLLAIATGFLLGQIRAWVTHRPYRPPEIKYTGLLVLGILPQWLAFQLPATRGAIPDRWASLALVASLIILLLFVLLNHGVPGFLVVGLGLVLNLLVIVVNGGWMPVSPETVARLYPQIPPDTFGAGERIGWSKDILLPRTDTRFWCLSDLIVTPTGLPYRSAVSLGDLFIALGVVRSLWTAAGPKTQETT